MPTTAKYKCSCGIINTKFNKMEEEIAKLVDKYLGMMPSDVNCKNWFIMRLNMIEEIKQLQLYNVRQQSELLKAYESMLLNAGDMTGKIKDQDRDDFIKAFNCA